MQWLAWDVRAGSVECSIGVLFMLVAVIFLAGFALGATASDSGNPYVQIVADKVRMSTSRANAAANLEAVATAVGLPPGTVTPASSLVPFCTTLVMAWRKWHASGHGVAS